MVVAVDELRHAIVHAHGRRRALSDPTTYRIRNWVAPPQQVDVQLLLLQELVKGHCAVRQRLVLSYFTLQLRVGIGRPLAAVKLLGMGGCDSTLAHSYVRGPAFRRTWRSRGIGCWVACCCSSGS
jgi:hypothetical protein